MSADATTVERHGGPDAEPPEPRRRGHAVMTVTVVLVIAAVLVWYWQSAASLVQGSETGPNFGAVDITSPNANLPPLPAWQMTEPDAWMTWTVRNTGSQAVTLSSGLPPSDGPNVMPRESLRFLPAAPEGGTPVALTGPSPTRLSDHISVGPGEEAFVALHVFFPAQCLDLSLPNGQPAVTTTFSRVPIDASALGRTTTVDVAMPQELRVRQKFGNTCPLEAFAGR